MFAAGIRIFQLFAAFTVALGLAAPAAATLYEMRWDFGLYGSLDQRDTDCPSFGCGPTSAVNSFVFLQKQYPSIYGNRLTGNAAADWIATANLLLGPDYMDTECCISGSGGTSVDNFISGKRKYFDAFAPGTTRVHAQEQPTWQFLLAELKQGQDIEVSLGFYGVGTGRVSGHYVTVTGISFNDGNNNNMIDAQEATLYFVDPADGMPGQNPLAVRDGFLEMPNYWVADRLATFIEVAVAESPMPEPGTSLLLVFGIFGVWTMRRRYDGWMKSLTSRRASPPWPAVVRGYAG